MFAVVKQEKLQKQGKTCTSHRLWCKAYASFSACDGIIENIPYIIAVNFNVNRIVRVLKQIELYDNESCQKYDIFPFRGVWYSDF